MSDEHTEKLQPIGVVARATNLTVKALRHYHEIGLLVPRSVDSWTGYRGYGPEEIDRAALIAALRALELPLAEMPVVLDDLGSDAARECLEAHRTRLDVRATELGALVARLDAFIDGRMDMTLPASLSRPQIIETTTQPAVVIEATATLEEVPTLIVRLFGEVVQALIGAGMDPTGEGPLFARYLENPQSGDPFRMQVGAPVRAGVRVAGLTAAELPGGRRVVAQFTGGYEGISEAWAAFYRLLIDEQYALADAPWESYVRSPKDSPNPNDWVTELVFPLAG